MLRQVVLKFLLLQTKILNTNKIYLIDLFLLLFLPQQAGLVYKNINQRLLKLLMIVNQMDMLKLKLNMEINKNITNYRI